MAPGLRREYRGKRNVLTTHTLNPETGCMLSKKVDVPADKKTMLRLVAANDDGGDWKIVVNVDGGVDPAANTWTINNVDPTADAGGLYTIIEGEDLAFDDSGSTDPGGDSLTYA
jgi:hypothetical protein